MTHLPVPDASGIYTFPNDIDRAHAAHSASLAARHAAGDHQVLELTAPYDGAIHHIEYRTPTGWPVLAIEPHHDDFALSASGTFLARPRPLTVVTVFSRSRSVHPSAEANYPTEEAVSELRAREGAAALAPFGAARRLLGSKDADPPYRAYEPGHLDQITEGLRALVAQNPGAELLAPAAVTRHPDHLLVHDAAVRLGCRWFWEDLAFWSTYALAGCDHHLFNTRHGSRALRPELVGITPVVLDKVTVLRMHGSQMSPPRKQNRPIRHAWTVAADLLDGGLYAERFYRTEH
ncbi:PIG-L deacetylase family protein [Streptomyces sp. NBC_00162]|uniref:PIG-L deacetylase family protein n=1 Tax=Streptomyces sp. NBC_00162 TaxID=2903629 RepID=UPI00214C56E2|nr:PIG-L family deacetylase [Streptomyces sp. NBC_00162]UUU44323.1 PIG-L family deacetylase [Streptomyces sp. NBC_00162]